MPWCADMLENKKWLYYRAYQYIKQNGELKKVNEWSEIKYLWMEGGNEKSKQSIYAKQSKYE